MIAERFQLAAASFCSLGGAFVSRIFSSKEHDMVRFRVHPADTCSLSLTPPGEETNQTTFFLNIKADHKCAGIDWIVLFWLCLLVHAVSWWPRWLLYEPLGNFLRKSHSGWTQCNAEKFSQAITAASFHILMGCFAFSVLKDKDWLWNFQLQWTGHHYHYDHDQDHQQENTVLTTEYPTSIVVSLVEPELKLYYLLYAARYISDMVSLFYEHPRSDTMAYAIHHLVTVVLVLASAHVGSTRIGGVIMFFFDWADPPMMIGKAILYLSLDKNDIFQWVADIFMGLFVVVFILTRNVIFNYLVFHIMRLQDEDFSPDVSPTVISLLKGMLLVLVGLMTFWLVMICKVLYYQFVLNDGNVDDIREEKDGQPSCILPGSDGTAIGIANHNKITSLKQE